MDATQRGVQMYSAAGNLPKAYAYATVAAIAHPRSRAMGLKMASYGIRVTANVARAGAMAAARTPLTYGGPSAGAVASRAAVFTGAVAAGYAVGAAVGTGIAYAGWGEEGASDAVALYTGQVSFSEYTTTVGTALEKTFFS